MNFAEIKLWPWKFIGIGIAALLAIGFVIFGVNRALDNARQSGRNEIQAKWDAEKAGAAKASAALSTALQQAFNGLDGTLQNTVRTITTKGNTITVRVKKELDNDPRYSSPDCSLSDGVRSEIDAARGLSGPSAATTVRSGGVPTSGAAVRLDIGNAGPR